MIGNASQHSPKFFANPLQQPFCQFFTTQVFYCTLSVKSRAQIKPSGSVTLVRMENPPLCGSPLPLTSTPM